ncbi:hypothetical protein B0I37DRAFT_148742 [Chaetomium sp. MPI-CAGE-AT-0009]|nr:hypothetical protein B0I37DRAFT_148742 [Chaetomium sp. MPI-CAGE-AT-0009]
MQCAIHKTLPASWPLAGQNAPARFNFRGMSITSKEGEVAAAAICYRRAIPVKLSGKLLRNAYYMRSVSTIRMPRVPSSSRLPYGLSARHPPPIIRGDTCRTRTHKQVVCCERGRINHDCWPFAIPFGSQPSWPKGQARQDDPSLEKTCSGLDSAASRCSAARPGFGNMKQETRGNGGGTLLVPFPSWAVRIAENWLQLARPWKSRSFLTPILFFSNRLCVTVLPAARHQNWNPG